MRTIRSSYDRLLDSNKILYMPSCLTVEMMTKLYGQVTLVNLSVKLHDIVPDLLVLLRRLTRDLKVTVAAHHSRRIHFFIGDWREDKLRARKLFFNLMSRLGYISKMIESVDKQLLYHAIEEMTREWSALDKLMEERLTKTPTEDQASWPGFRRHGPDNWRRELARVVLDLDEKTAGGKEGLKNGRKDGGRDGAYLILLCYRRVKISVLQAIDQLERRRGVRGRFDPDRILCVSDEELPITCSTCAMMTDSIRSHGAELIPCHYAKSQDTFHFPRQRSLTTFSAPAAMPAGRRPMPVSLAGMGELA